VNVWEAGYFLCVSRRDVKRANSRFRVAVFFVSSACFCMFLLAEGEMKMLHETLKTP
jgi:hypothetical protein